MQQSSLTFHHSIFYKVNFLNVKHKKILIRKQRNNFSTYSMTHQESSSIEEEKEKKKIAEIQRLREAEKFMEIDEGKFECQGCGYIYEPIKGDRFAGIEAGVQFSALPESFNCPACRSNKSQFKSIKKVIAGFADNQKYGLGANSLTGGQKNLIIFGSLSIAFILFLSGYLLE